MFKTKGIVITKDALLFLLLACEADRNPKTVIMTVRFANAAHLWRNYLINSSNLIQSNYTIKSCTTCYDNWECDKSAREDNMTQINSLIGYCERIDSVVSCRYNYESCPLSSTGGNSTSSRQPLSWSYRIQMPEGKCKLGQVLWLDDYFTFEGIDWFRRHFGNTRRGPWS